MPVTPSLVAGIAKVETITGESMSDEEKFLARFVGGPIHGATLSMEPPWTWPLPEEFKQSDLMVLGAPDWPAGRYVKARESQLPPQAANAYVRRGAEYLWVEA